MRIDLIAVGKLKEKFWIDAVGEYKKRLSRFCNLQITEVPEGKTKSEEFENIIKKTKGYIILFDLNGELLSSKQFSKVFSDTMVSGVSHFSLIIGGSEGVDKRLIDRADKVISFGRVTYPHQLMRVIVCEQVYRAITIINNITYHK
ncbi:MAG: 23S rRNA (pseudouridine(1915)-N(3))-methyltransferase RlmH [Bacillota bacterium]